MKKLIDTINTDNEPNILNDMVFSSVCVKTNKMNIHIIPTAKPSRLYEFGGQIILTNEPTVAFRNQNIYITSDEEIKEGVNKWYLNKPRNSSGSQYGKKQNVIILTTDQDLIKDGVQAINDEFLEWFVKNPSCEEVEVERHHGINTSIAEVNAISGDGSLNWEGKSDLRDYKIIIPKEEPKQELIELKKQFQIKADEALELNSNIGNFGRPKQETLEEAAEKYIETSHYMNKDRMTDIIFGAKWQQERMYSEEDLKQFAFECVANFLSNNDNKVEIKLVDIIIDRVNDKFKQFKKK